MSDPKVEEIRAETFWAFWSNVEVTGFCWNWLGTKFEGYGSFAPGVGRSHRAHRWAYEYLVGPIPGGLVIDHLCRNRSCVNPDHMEAVTSRENTLRGFAQPSRNARKTHCKRGHEFTPENTQREAGTDYRKCRTCLNARLATPEVAAKKRSGDAVYRARKRAERDLSALLPSTPTECRHPVTQNKFGGAMICADCNVVVGYWKDPQPRLSMTVGSTPTEEGKNDE